MWTNLLTNPYFNSFAREFCNICFCNSSSPSYWSLVFPCPKIFIYKVPVHCLNHSPRLRWNSEAHPTPPSFQADVPIPEKTTSTLGWFPNFFCNFKRHAFQFQTLPMDWSFPLPSLQPSLIINTTFFSFFQWGYTTVFGEISIHCRCCFDCFNTV